MFRFAVKMSSQIAINTLINKVVLNFQIGTVIKQVVVIVSILLL